MNLRTNSAILRLLRAAELENKSVLIERLFSRYNSSDARYFTAMVSISTFTPIGNLHT